jgi:hypothetical protein
MNLPHLLKGKIIAEPQSQKISNTSARISASIIPVAFRKTLALKLTGFLKNIQNTSYRMILRRKKTD